ncbi:hypothetical protein F4778DRAFT_695729 [Xylariomycetidae sp. FL2044]|nr:hypothetical protein F4778DRAFT_695729 [Xylariomycetidae sp. FL2044]
MIGENRQFDCALHLMPERRAATATPQKRHKPLPAAPHYPCIPLSPLHSFVTPCTPLSSCLKSLSSTLAARRSKLTNSPSTEGRQTKRQHKPIDNSQAAHLGGAPATIDGHPTRITREPTFLTFAQDIMYIFTWTNIFLIGYVLESLGLTQRRAGRSWTGTSPSRYGTPESE